MHFSPWKGTSCLNSAGLPRHNHRSKWRRRGGASGWKPSWVDSETPEASFRHRWTANKSPPTGSPLGNGRTSSKFLMTLNEARGLIGRRTLFATPAPQQFPTQYSECSSPISSLGGIVEGELKLKSDAGGKQHVFIGRRRRKFNAKVAVLFSVYLKQRPVKLQANLNPTMGTVH